jgi:hypothetical protein
LALREKNSGSDLCIINQGKRIEESHRNHTSRSGIVLFFGRKKRFFERLIGQQIFSWCTPTPHRVQVTTISLVRFKNRFSSEKASFLEKKSF